MEEIQYYADSDENGNINAFYNDDVWDVTKIPKTAIKITEEQWQECNNNEGKWIVTNGALTLDTVNYPKPVPDASSLPPTLLSRIEALEAIVFKTAQNG